VIAPLSWEDLLLTAGTSLIVLPSSKLFEHIHCCCFVAGVLPRTDGIDTGSPATAASVALTALAKLRSQPSLPKKLTTNISTVKVPMLAIQTLLHRHGILFHLLSPRLAEVVVENVPERPVI
jgi:hypothetical protein